MQTQSRQDLGIPFNPKSGYLGWLSTTRALSASQKNANRQPHLPLLIGLQHPGGAHTRGLRTGKDGINTVGRMTNGTSSLKKLVTRLQNDVIDKNQKTWPPSWFIFLVAFRVQSAATHWTRREFFSCVHHGASSAHFQCGRTTLAQGEMSWHHL